jgi:hypothetical protein
MPAVPAVVPLGTTDSGRAIVAAARVVEWHVIDGIAPLGPSGNSQSEWIVGYGSATKA